MGSFDGAETCELVGTYILNIISSVIPKENIGLYRDDGLAIICQPAPVVEHIQKKLRKEFNQLGLNITVQAHTTTTDFFRHHIRSGKEGVPTMHKTRKFPPLCTHRI